VKDLYVGCRLRVLMHEFLLLDTNDGTLRWMEDNNLPRSNVFAILDKLRPFLLNDAKSGKLAAKFQSYESTQQLSSQSFDENHSNSNNNNTLSTSIPPQRATKETLRAILQEYYLMNDMDSNKLSEHELRTILRASGNKLPHFDYMKFIDNIIQPTKEYK
jgi:hypothetical protein